MIATFFQRKRQRLLEWWRAPVTRKDRAVGAIVGGIACLWIGALGRIIVGPLPVSLEVVAWWAAGGVAVGVVLGVLYPKATTCVLFPFSTTGIGGGT